jgi:hypothetical protein
VVVLLTDRIGGDRYIHGADQQRPVVNAVSLSQRGEVPGVEFG